MTETGEDSEEGLLTAKLTEAARVPGAEENKAVGQSRMEARPPAGQYRMSRGGRGGFCPAVSWAEALREGGGSPWPRPPSLGREAQAGHDQA